MNWTELNSLCPLCEINWNDVHYTRGRDLALSEGFTFTCQLCNLFSVSTAVYIIDIMSGWQRWGVWCAVQGYSIQQRVIPDDTQDVRQRWWTAGRQGEGWSRDSKTAVERHRRWWWYVSSLHTMLCYCHLWWLMSMLAFWFGCVQDNCKSYERILMKTCPPFTPARQTSTRFTYSGGIEGWVGLGGWLYTEMVYLTLSADSHPSK